MFTTIGTALGQPSTRYDRQRVRRHSYPAGRCEALFWRRTARQDLRRIVLAARRYDLAGRAQGRRNGPLGHIALELLDLLANLVSYRTGRLEPSVAFLMERLRRSRDAVVRALAALQAHGFLDKMRRFEPTGREGRGPQVRQVSNAYRLVMPPQALRLLGLHGRPAPLPDDVAHAQEAQRQERDAYMASLPLDELAAHQVTDTALAGLLAQLGRRLAERESGRREEIQPKSP
jgi:hypothetical protein